MDEIPGHPFRQSAGLPIQLTPITERDHEHAERAVLVSQMIR